MSEVAKARIGISGWAYPRWRGHFYPRGLVQRRELEYAASRLNSVEINASFYSLQRPSSFVTWREQTPDDFVFAVKGSRYVTHMKKLAGVDIALANLFASGMLALGAKLGPVLWQLPPNLGYDPERLEQFFALLPRTTAAVADLAGRHDSRLDGRAWTTTDAERPVRHTLEVRHRSFEDPGFVELLRAHGIGLVIADTAGKWPRLDSVTTGFVYVRLHGSRELYVSGYTDAELDTWASRVRTWTAEGLDVYVYFDNDAAGHAPFDAVNLTARVTAPEEPPQSKT